MPETKVSERVYYKNTSGTVNNRTNDKITKFTLFARGSQGVGLNFDYTNSMNNSTFGFDKSYIDTIHPSVFKNPNSWFYSCNTAAGGDDSFLYVWQHTQVGGFAG